MSTDAIMTVSIPRRDKSSAIDDVIHASVVSFGSNARKMNHIEAYMMRNKESARSRWSSPEGAGLGRTSLRFGGLMLIPARRNALRFIRTTRA